MSQFFDYVSQAFKEFVFLDFIEIILLAAAVYYVSIYIKKLSAHWYNKFLFVFIVAGVILGVSDLKMARTLFADVLVIIILVTVIIFAQDIKRGVWKLSRPHGKSQETKGNKEFSDDDLRRSVAEIVRATQNLAKKNVGALMIFSRTGLPVQIIESGTGVDAKISSQIIETIFFENTPLHDGAVIFAENALVAAGCFLPLSVELNIPKELGTRHRAAIGITEVMSDAIALVVSEETGIISIAYQGKIYRYLDTDQLTAAVQAGLGLSELSEMPMLKTDKEEEK